MFFDFSSAFNTIQPHLLVQKLLNHNIPGSILAPGGGGLNFELGTDVRPEVSTTTL